MSHICHYVLMWLILPQELDMTGRTVSHDTPHSVFSVILLRKLSLVTSPYSRVSNKFNKIGREILKLWMEKF